MKKSVFVMFFWIFGTLWANSSPADQTFRFDPKKTPYDYLQSDRGKLPDSVSVEKDGEGGNLAFRGGGGFFWFHPGQELSVTGGEIRIRLRTTFEGSLGVLLGAEKAGDPAYIVYLSINQDRSVLMLSKSTALSKQEPGKNNLSRQNNMNDSSGQWRDLKISLNEDKAGGVNISAELLDEKGKLISVVAATDGTNLMRPKGKIGLRISIETKTGAGSIEIQSISLRKI